MPTPRVCVNLAAPCAIRQLRVPHRPPPPRRVQLTTAFSPLSPSPPPPLPSPAAGDFGKQLELPSSRSGGDVSLADEAGGGAVARGGSSSGGPGGKITAGRAILEKLKNRQPYYERNRARVCTFWAKGNCTRGERCPYRHEMPKNPDGPLAKQTMKDRYYGNNDPVAAKMLSRFGGVYGEGIAAAKRH